MKYILFLFLGLSNTTLMAQDYVVEITFSDSVENSIVRLRSIKLYKEVAFAKDLHISIPEDFPYNDGYISIFDTARKVLLMELPVFFEGEDVQKVYIKEITNNYRKLSHTIEYFPAKSNMQNLAAYLNTKEAYIHYGIKQDGAVFLDGLGEQTLLKENLRLIRSNPSDFFSLYFLKNYFKGYRRYLEGDLVNEFVASFHLLSDDLRQSVDGQELSRELDAFHANYNRSRIEKEVPDFDLKAVDGKHYTSKTLIGKPYIIAFSATWCGPCLESLPKLKSIYKAYRSKGLEVLYVNLHDDQEEWSKLIENYDLEWLNVSEMVKYQESKVAKLFNLQGIPNYFLINREGKIVYNDAQLNDYNFDLLEEYVINNL